MKNKIKLLAIFLATTIAALADDEVFDGLTISGKDILGGTYKNSSWIGTTIEKSTFTGTNFNESNFSTVKIKESNFEHVDISDSIFDGAEFDRVSFVGVTAKNTSFKKAKMIYHVTNFKSGIFDGADFSETVLSISGLPVASASTSLEYFAMSASFENSSLIGANFSKAKLTKVFPKYASGWLNWEKSSVNFSGADLTGVNFSDTYLVSSYHESTSKVGSVGVVFSTSTILKSVNFTNATLGNNYIALNLSGFDLSNSDFTNALLNRVSFVNSTVTNVNFSNARKLTTNQLSETKNYKNKNLSGIKFNGLDLTDWDLSGQNLQNTSFVGANLTGVNARYADLRGSDLTGITGSLKTQNTIWTDGEIKNFTMESVDDSLSILAYVPATSGGAMINAKIADDASISGGAMLTLEQGAVLEIASGKTLSVLDDSEIIFNVDAASDATKILLGENSRLAFGSDSKITINLDGTISPDDSYTFSVIEMAVGSQVTGTDSLKKENVILNVNGEEYDSSKWTFDFDSSTGALNINVNVPEPAEWAMIFGAVTLAFAAYRRRK